MKKTKDIPESSILPDEQIVELYWNREEKAIKATDDKYGRYLMTIAYNIVHDDLDSEECLNDTYLGTWNSIPPARPTALQVFLSKIMRCVAINKFKSKMRQKRVASELAVSIEELESYISTDNSIEDERMSNEIGRVINEFLESLDDNSATMFICRYYYSDKVNDIADMMCVHRTTVSRSLADMRDRLKERLIKEGLWYEQQ